MGNTNHEEIVLRALVALNAAIEHTHDGVVDMERRHAMIDVEAELDRVDKMNAALEARRAENLADRFGNRVNYGGLDDASK